MLPDVGACIPPDCVATNSGPLRKAGWTTVVPGMSVGPGFVTDRLGVGPIAEIPGIIPVLMIVGVACVVVTPPDVVTVVLVTVTTLEVTVKGTVLA